MKAFVILTVLFMASFSAYGNEADVNSDMDIETFYRCYEYPEIQEMAPWIAECHIFRDSVQIRLSDDFPATDLMCQNFGQMVYNLLSNPDYGFWIVNMIPNSDGWIPSAYNPIDLEWARCLADETLCPMAGYDPIDQWYPPNPPPTVRVQEKKDSGGGCFIQTIKGVIP